LIFTECDLLRTKKEKKKKKKRGRKRAGENGPNLVKYLQGAKNKPIAVQALHDHPRHHNQQPLNLYGMVEI